MLHMVPSYLYPVFGIKDERHRQMDTEKTYRCTNSHWLVPNGCGDLDLYCGEKRLDGAFVPYFSRFGLDGHCNVCDCDVRYDDE